jgi:hypothetical protein
MGPRFSVLLPTHDRADVIGSAMRSVLGQTVQDFELLIVGDGCTDGTADVVLAFDDERIRWFDLPKAPDFGYANRNAVLREARGDLIAFIAHDDLLLPDHLELLGARFDEARVEWAYSRPTWISDDGLIVPFAVDLRRPDQLDFFLNAGNSIPASCVVHRRSCLGRYGLWPEDVPSAGDWEYWKSILRPSHGTNLAYVPEATTLHFRAAWRERALWGPRPLHGWLEIESDRRAWPGALQVIPVAGEPLQASVLGALEHDPPGWTSGFRAGIAEAMDVLAWTQAGEVARLADSLSQWQAEAERRSVEAAAAMAALRAEVDLARGETEAAERRRDEAARALERAAAEAARAVSDAEAARISAGRAAAEADAASSNAEHARAELRSVLGSRSWRLTAPLRGGRYALEARIGRSGGR